MCMHHGKIFMPRGKSFLTARYSCLAENIMHHKKIFMHHKNHASRVNIDASQKNASRVDTPASRKIVHCRNIFMPHGKYHASQEDIHVSQKNSHIARESHALQKRNYAQREQEIVCLKKNGYPSTSMAFPLF